MASKEEEFKQRLVVVLKDLHEAGKKDAEAMWLLGSLSAVIVDKANRKSWRTFKKNVARETYDGLLHDFQNQGNALYKQGKKKQAWAMQLLGMSLVARTQADPEVQAGAELLDEAIERATAFYRKNKHMGTAPG